MGSRIFSFALLFFISFLYLPISLHAQDRNSFEKHWATIDSLENIGLPKSAYEKTLIVLALAEKQNNKSEFVKSLIYKSKYLIQIEETKDDESFAREITRLEQEVTKVSQPAKSILQSMLGEMYFSYLQTNSWKFENRTNTKNFNNDDITTWTKKDYYEKAIYYYNISIQDEPPLLTPLSDYKNILTNFIDKKGKDDFTIYPTLFDFLLKRAILFYSNEQTFLTKPAYQFSVDDDSYFDAPELFIKKPLFSNDSFSAALHVLKLYQKLLQLHLQDKDQTIFLVHDLARINFVYSKSIHPEKENLYIKSLEKIIEVHQNNPFSSDAYLQIAQWYYQKGNKYKPTTIGLYQWDLKTAISWCDKTIKRFPDARGSIEAAYLKASIVSPSIQLEGEKVYLPNTFNLIKLSYKNVDTIYYRILELNNQYINNPYYDSEYEESQDAQKTINSFLKNKTLKSGEISIPNLEDYQLHHTELKIDALPIGRFVLVLSRNKNFEQNSNLYSYHVFTNSHISYLAKSDTKSGCTSYYVLHRKTGQPLTNVKVEFYDVNYNNNNQKYQTRLKGIGASDKNGLVKNCILNTSIIPKFILDKDVLFENNSSHNYHQKELKQPDQYKTNFFLDRTIYRPGQTIYFKALLSLHQDNLQPVIAPNQKITIVFKDVNYQTVKELQLITNEYGTVQGSFTAPSSGLNGQMHISSNYNGQKYFQVEEYKRPKFEIVFKKIEKSYTLGDTVNAMGTAKSFSGVPIDNALVKYRVVRETSFPYWPWWKYGWYNPFMRETMEITHGITRTDATGNYDIKFIAIADKSIDKEYQPQFLYEVHAEVIDISGETHEEEFSVRVGYVGIDAHIQLLESINKDSVLSISISTNNINGNFEPSACSLIIEQLQLPSRIYTKRYWDFPDMPIYSKEKYNLDFPNFAYKTEDQIESWAAIATIYKKEFNTADIKILNILELKSLAPGVYKIRFYAFDKSGEKIEKIHYVTSYDLSQKSVSSKEYLFNYNTTPTVEVNNKASIHIGSAVDKLHYLFEKISNGTLLESRWVVSSGLQQYQFLCDETMRGNLLYNAYSIYNNRTYKTEGNIYIPYESKDLKISYTSFRDILQPGSEEEWTLKIAGPKGGKIAAEMLVSMYDASLDNFSANNYAFNLGNGQRYSSYSQWNAYDFNAIAGINHTTLLPFNKAIPEGYQSPQLNWFNYPFGGNQYGYFDGAEIHSLRSMAPSNSTGGREDRPSKKHAYAIVGKKENADFSEVENESDKEEKSSSSTNDSAKSGFSPRTNLKETVFFYPNLYTDSTGNILIKFKMNEALTRWKFLGMAHDKNLNTGFLERHIVTQKELMIVPNIPRFLRVEDSLILTAKINNVSPKNLEGEASLMLFDAISNTPIDIKFNNIKNIQPFKVLTGLSTVVSWKLTIPAGIEAVTYRILAQSETFSDGEEATLPIIPNTLLVTETLPLPIRGGQQKTFDFKSMRENSKSPTLINYNFTLEFTTNPVWYAVQALPYIMEYPYDCTEQIFSRYYANTLASYVTNKHSSIKRVFEAWKGTDALKSNLSKNEALKSVLLEETPWVLDAQNEATQKQQIALLFDLNKIASESESSMKQLLMRQAPNGGFPWFSGGRDDWYITQYLLEGFGHLNHLKLSNALQNKEIESMLHKAINYTDNRVIEQYENLLQHIKKYGGKLEDDHLDYLIIHYLYMRSFYTYPMNPDLKKVFSYYISQSEKYWTTKGIYMQGMMALYLYRNNTNNEISKNILKSLKEKSFNNEELGMYWKISPGYYWHELPIETHSLMIEVFNEIAKDAKAVDELKIWLLKNKQTNSWKTTKATASAIYALLSTGDNWLENSKEISINIGNKKFDYTSVQKEAGSGYFKSQWRKEKIDASFAKIEISNPNANIAFGAVYWQFFEKMDKIRSFRETPLKIKKDLFREINTDGGPILQPISTVELNPGDKIKVRIELTVDRAMEYIHMKDTRASGLEPINVLSAYKYQGGLGYYESTKDLATHFFFHYLPKGVYVFEYPLVVNHKGDFSNGITTIQSMYAPEFTSHSEGKRISIK